MRHAILIFALLSFAACSDNYTPGVTDDEPKGAVGASSGPNPNVPPAVDDEKGEGGSTGDAWRAEGGTPPPVDKKPRP